MKKLIGYAAAALLLTACNQPPAAPKAESLLFPALGSAPYAADYAMNMGDTQKTMRILRSGASQRMESATGQAGRTGVMLIDAASGKMYSFQSGEGAPKAALLIDRTKLGALSESMDIETEAKATPPKHLGSDTVAGVGCEIWEMQRPAAPAPDGAAAAPAEADATVDARQICVTRDGILLRVQKTAATQPEMVATKVDRGPQDASLFAVPADYAIVDMSECTNAMAGMMAAIKSGKKPDLAVMQKCQSAAKLMGGM